MHIQCKEENYFEIQAKLNCLTQLFGFKVKKEKLLPKLV